MDLLHYYADYRVLVCKSCRYAVQPNHIAAHLRSDQHRLSRQQSQEIADRYGSYDLANPQTELIAPESVISPIEHLPIYRDGLSCNHCHFVCRSRDWILRHQRQVHNIKAGRGRKIVQVEWSTVWCQQFFTGVGRHFFPVQETNR